MPSSNWAFSIQSGQLDKAKERFVQAIDLAPERAEPLVQLGMLELMEESGRGLIHFERAVLVDSTAHNAWFFQAQCHERLGNPGLALAGYQRLSPCPRISSSRRSANASTSATELIKSSDHAQWKEAQAP